MGLSLFKVEEKIKGLPSLSAAKPHIEKNSPDMEQVKKKDTSQILHFAISLTFLQWRKEHPLSPPTSAISLQKKAQVLLT